MVRLFNAGANGIVLFNRFYTPDLNLDTLKMKAGPRFSTEAEFPPLLRWIGIIASQLKDLDISASTGIHSWESVVKALMAGAGTVRLCSVLYKNGISSVTEMLDRIDKWMDSKAYKSISDFQGSMQADSGLRGAAYDRLQYVKAISV